MKFADSPTFAFITIMQPWLLLFGVGALIPVLIHFLHRNSHRRMPWAATHYLTLALEQIARRFSFYQLLLLILRIFAVLLLAVCLATPFLNNPLWFEKSDKLTTLKIILIDNSFSMQVKEQGQTRFEDGKRIAIDIVERASEGDGFMVAAYDSRLQPVISRAIASKVETQDAISRIPVGNQPTNVRKVLPELIELCNSDQRMFFDLVEVHFISDFAAKDWGFLDSAQGTLDSPGIADREKVPAGSVAENEPGWQQLLDIAEFDLHKVRAQQHSNNFVSRIKVARPVSIANTANFVEVQIENQGAQETQTVLLELRIGDKIVASKPTQVQPNSRSTVTADFSLGQLGTHLIEARISPDALELDNRRFLKLEVRDQYRVAFVEGKAQSTKFLELALEPNPQSNSRFQIKTLTPTVFSSSELRAFDAIFIDNVRRFSQTDVRRLFDFARSGKPVILFLGDLIDRQQFNDCWNSDPANRLGVKLIGVQPVDDYRIDPLGYQSPFVKAFRGNPDAGLTTLPIWVYLKSQILEPSKINTDLAFTNGDPLLLSKRVGQGSVILFVSSSSSLSKVRGQTDIPWNANETSPGFTALVQELFNEGMQQVTVEEFQIGQTGRGQFEARTRIEETSLLGPTGEALEVKLIQNDDRASWISDPLQLPGFYSLTARTRSGELNQEFAVNVDTIESDILTFEPSQTAETQVQTGLNSPRSASSANLFQLLLLVLLVILILESIVALRFGRENG